MAPKDIDMLIVQHVHLPIDKCAPGRLEASHYNMRDHATYKRETTLPMGYDRNACLPLKTSLQPAHMNRECRLPIWS